MTATFRLSDINTVQVNAATEGGENTLVAAVEGKSIVVVGYTLTVNAEGLVELKDASGTRAQLTLAKGIPANYRGEPACPAFKCAEGKALVLKTAAAQKAFGHIAYILV